MPHLILQVPDPPRDDKGKIIDSTWQYYYYRNHYFDNFDISDPRLLRTPLYEDKVMTYLTKVIPQIPDSLILVRLIIVIEKSRADSNLFRFMLITLFNYYGKSNIMGMDAVQVHIADKYYIHESWWSDDKFIADLKDRVEKTKPLLIGKIAPDVELMLVPPDHFKSAQTDTALEALSPCGYENNTLTDSGQISCGCYSGRQIAVIVKKQFPNCIQSMRKALRTWVLKFLLSVHCLERMEK